MFGVVLFLMMLDGFILTAVVLMQAGQGGGLAALGGGTASQVLGGRQATTVLTKMTWITGGLFMAMALFLSILSSGGRTGSASAVQENLRKSAVPTAPMAPANGGSAAELLNTPKNAPIANPAAAAPATAKPPAGGGKPPAPAPVKKP